MPHRNHSVTSDWRTGLAALVTVWAVAAAVAGESAGNEASAVNRDWVREHVLEVEWKAVPPRPAAVKAVPPGLKVLANNDPVQLNTKSGKPMMIGTKEYSRGLYCHAVSRVLVQLPGPGKTLSAVVGVDTNNAPDVKGSVVFSVSVGDKVAFRSEVLRGKTEGVPVEVDLAGATEFVLDVGDAGDGIAYDQANWADAKVQMADGKELWLGELPLREERQDVAAPKMPERSTRLPFSFVYRGLPSDSLLAQWPAKTTQERIGTYGTRVVRSWAEPATGLEVRWVARTVGVVVHP